MNFRILRKARVLRDLKTREAVAAVELVRQAYRYITRNEQINPKIRQQAQLMLNSFPRQARPTSVKNRCVETGRGRGVFRDSRLCRYQFRLKALAGEIPGVKKAVW
ncbi:4872_t:CDS:1 [Acaulospora colombiana]|uniref:4872_t:CDS:1 n=1 Tax=Acaulospora colombiana TaxID=27376 RepID=A0ACA9K7Z2_9GLOM|nr:4872_t:CDS:1 [Acaulospora colombiana]